MPNVNITRGQSSAVYVYVFDCDVLPIHSVLPGAWCVKIILISLRPPHSPVHSPIPTQ